MPSHPILCVSQKSTKRGWRQERHPAIKGECDRCEDPTLIIRIEIPAPLVIIIFNSERDKEINY